MPVASGQICPGVNGERDKYHVFSVEFANDLITVDERCIGGGGLVHMSKFSAFMALKVVVCIGSDSVENVFSVRLVGLGGRRGPGDVDVCPNGGVWAMVACCGVVRE